MHDSRAETASASCAEGLAASFGTLVRQRREALGLRQEDIALATGFGRRFIIELEAGKASCQIGKALAVAAAVGLRLLDLPHVASEPQATPGPARELARV